jgi:hypothetical protein
MRRHFNKFKQTLKRQTGKSQGNYRISRGAELAVYAVLAEQLKAHRRPGDGVIKELAILKDMRNDYTQEKCEGLPTSTCQNMVYLR